MKGAGGEIPTLVRILDRSILLLEEKICWVSILFPEAEEFSLSSLSMITLTCKLDKKIWMTACKLR